MTYVDPFAPADSPHHPANAGKPSRERGQIPEPDLTEEEHAALLELWPLVLGTFGTEEEQGREFDPWLGEELLERRPEYKALLAEFGTEGERAETVLADDEEDEDVYADDAPTLRDLRARQADRQAEPVAATEPEIEPEAAGEPIRRPAASAPKPLWKAYLRELDPEVTEEEAEAMTVDVLKARTRELAAK